MKHSERSGDEGAVMVFLLFAVVLLAGFAWLIISTGGRLVSRQSLQAAVDATAWGGAVAMAKALNILAFTNWLMAAMLAVAIAIQLLADLLVIAAIALTGICTGGCWIGIGCFACPWIYPAEQAAESVRGVSERVKEFAQSASRGIMSFQDVVANPDSESRWFPVGLADVAAVAAAIGVGQENASDATVIPVPPGKLPVVRGSYEELCDRALDMVDDMVEAVLPWPIDDLAGSAARDLAQSGRDYYCGGEGAPPTTRVTVDRAVPESCGSSDASDCFDYATCDAPLTDCGPQDGDDCGESCLPRGAGCAPCMRRIGDVDMKSFVVRGREDVTVRRYTQRDWQQRNERAVTPTSTTATSEEEVEERSTLPCPIAEWHCAAEWHCIETSSEASAPFEVDDQIYVEQTQTDVRYVLESCVYESTYTVNAGEIDSSTRELRPVTMQPRWLEDARNQYRGMVIEGGDPSRRRRAVGIAAGAAASSPLRDWASTGLAVAQAEFLTTAEPGNELWQVGWQAFLRRFYMPSAENLGEVGSAMPDWVRDLWETQWEYLVH